MSIGRTRPLRWAKWIFGANPTFVQWVRSASAVCSGNPSMYLDKERYFVAIACFWDVISKIIAFCCVNATELILTTAYFEHV